ncbi:hypothetical protein [Sphingomonas japonica]|uniref:Uncharacterized protein n=1 Tax=Sphingomonas japonica TaxID=511662 RepID=A0ABX0U3Z4_9SPHN|nr:hypothetical protein [Sphingomonas japonica]NIJ24101.1 hypothetical protein [Sphingomonas japonica]
MGQGEDGIVDRIRLAWPGLSVLFLWVVGLGPHGYILLAFMPFWFGSLVSLIIAMVRWNKERRTV